MDKKGIEAFFAGLREKRILVIGDVMLDAYQWGKVDRISPEAPVPVVEVLRNDARPGGAANVCLNLVHMGVKTHILSVIGNDEAGVKLQHLMKVSGIRTEALMITDHRPTTVKTRVMGGNQQLLRIDRETSHDLMSQEIAPMQTWLQQNIESFDAIVLQDYDKGVLTPDFIHFILKLSREKGIPTAVDPKKRHFNDFKGADLFKPNLKELREGLKIQLRAEETGAIGEAAMHLRKFLHCENILITLSEYGVFYQSKTESGTIPAHIRSISDVSGAGDTVISIAACCLAQKTSLAFLATLANLAGGLVCEEVGVVPINSANLLHEAFTHLVDKS